jgi:hypothetical protein
MRKSILIIAILSIAALCFAGPLQEMHKRVIAGSTVAGGGIIPACSSGSQQAECDSQDSSTELNATNAKGQGPYDPGEDSYLYSIEVYVYRNSGSDTSITCRWGNSQDLSSSYYGESTSDTISETGWWEVVFGDTVNQMANGGSYYFSCVKSDDVSGYYIQRDTDGSSPISGTYRYGTGWNIDTSGSPYDINMRVNKCAD